MQNSPIETEQPTLVNDTQQKLKESEQRLRSIVESAPFPIGVYVGREMRIELLNDAIIKVWGKEGNLVGKLYSEALPELEGKGIYEQLDKVFTTGIPFHAKNQQVDLVFHGKLQPFYFNYSFTPLFDTAGKVYGVMNTAAEVTDLVLANKKIEEAQSRFHDSVMQAPVGMCILKGRNMIVELANATYLQIVDRKEEEMLGRSLYDSLPEVRTAVEPLLLSVMEKGKPVYGNEFMVYLNRHGSKDPAYFNFVYQPLKEIDGSTSGVIVVANEITEMVESKHAIAENARQFKEFITQSPVSMVIFRGPDFIIENPNRALLEGIWHKELEEVQGKKLFDVFPELHDQQFPKLLDAVFKKGIPYREKESMAMVEGNEGMKKYYLDFQYAPLFENNGDVSGIMVTLSDVTDKVEARKSIEESEQRLILSNEAAHLGTFDWNIAENKLVQSDRLVQIFGFEQNETVTHQQLIERFHPEDRPIRDKALELSLIDGFLNYEVRIVWPNKSIHWIKVYGKVVHDENKQPQRMFGTVMDTTETKNSLIALEESESKLNIAIDATELGTFDINLQEEDIKYSPKYLEIYGFKPTDKPNRKDVIARVHPDDIPSRAQAMEVATKTGVLDHETKVIHDDGSLHWVRIKGKVITDKFGQPERVLGTVRDITNEKKATQQLQENEERLNIAVESAELGTWELDLKTRKVFFSSQYLQILGYEKGENPPHEELVTKIHPEDLALRNEQMEKAIRVTGSLDYEMRLVPKKDTVRWIRARGKVFYDDDGQPKKMLGTIMDITDQKNALLVLEKNEKLLEEKVAERTAELQLSKEINFKMVNEVQDYAILLMSKDGYIQNWNRGAEKIKGYTAEEIMGQHFSMFYTDKARQDNAPNKFLEKARSTGRATDEGWRVRKNGGMFWANVVITALHNENNEVIGFSKVTRDLTEKRMAEQALENKSVELQKANASLEKSNTELEQFAYIASHDLQEPLRKIQFFVEQLQKTVPDLQETSKLYFDKIKNSTTRMNTLINDLLDFSRLSQSNEKYVQVDLDNVVALIRNDFELLVQQKTACITVASLPTIEAIPLQMQQLFYNLISNALKFSKEDEPCRIDIDCKQLTEAEAEQYHELEKGRKYFSITIQDNGIGFDQQYAEKIFVIFQRLNGLHAYGGTGIGLALCKKIVLNHKGEIFAKSKEGEGSIFHIILPEKQSND